jgi:dual specificity MAP kinase phosphatase
MNHGEEDISFSRITKYIAVGIKPTRLALDHLKKLGFKNVIDLNADPQEAKNAHQAGISYHPAEVRDTDPIEVWLTKFDLAAGIIRRASEKSEPVYLHCTYGKGRSPTMAMAYLVSQGHTVKDTGVGGVLLTLP